MILGQYAALGTFGSGDTTPPTYTLTPATTAYSLVVGNTFTLPVLTLTDNVDATTTPSPTINTVDMGKAGSYTITWSGLGDSSGNTIDDVLITIEVLTELFPDLTGLVLSKLNSNDISKESVFLGRSNRTYYKITDFEEPFNLTDKGITLIEIKVSEGTLSSSTNNVNINGIGFSIKYGALDIQPGVHPVRIILYTALDNEGHILIGEGLKQSILLNVIE
jgi:hypothetical protein